jgi:ATP-dependent helicase/nuclease subunit B
VTLRIELTPYGAPAFEQLRTLIDEAKGDDPFRPVTVVVPRGTVGLAVRRELASGVSAGGRRGVANVSFVTLAGLADSLVGSTLAGGGRLPLTDAVLRAAIVNVLASAAAPLLASARDHPSTIDALALTYREMRVADESALDALGRQSARAAEVVSVLRAVRARTMEHFDDVDTLLEAARVVGSGGHPMGQWGPVVLYLPLSLSAPGSDLVRALAANVTLTAVIGLTGDADADRLAQLVVDSLQPDEQSTAPTPFEVPSGDFVLSAPTADAEVLLVLRDVMERFDAGTPLEAMAIAHGGSPQYVTLLHNTLREAGIPFNGGGARTLSSTVAGRVLLGVLFLPDSNWRREEVIEWLHTGPIVQYGRPIPSARWDVLSAECGIREDLEEWHRQLATRAEQLREEAARGPGGRDDPGEDVPWRQARLADAQRCVDLGDMVSEMASELGEQGSSWNAWARWSWSLLERLVGGSSAFDGWPAAESAAATAVRDALDRLSELAQIGANFSPAAARAALVAELNVPAPQTTRFGAGVWVTPLSALVGHSVDVLYVVGMTDGVFPGRTADDVLLPDRERTVVQSDGSLPLRGVRTAAMCRDYLAALAGARLRRLSFPRGNQRDGRALRPSRWVLDALGRNEKAGVRLYSKDLEVVSASPTFRVEPSFLASVAAAGAPISLEDRDTRSLLAWTASGRRATEHPLCREDPTIGRGLELAEGRALGFTRFNGKVGPGGPPLPAVLSATRLETFARCPRRYFFESVLHVVPRAVSERLFATDRLEYGSLVHEILEEYVRPLIGRRPGDGPDDPFAVARLMEIAEERLRGFEESGLAAPGAAWRAERVRLLRELRLFAAADTDRRLRLGVVTEDVEREFGGAESEPVVVDVVGRQPVIFRGKIDRVDVTPAGGKVVTDYKTGGSHRYKGIEEDHFQGGSAVQLPIYALAEGASDGQRVRSEYWCVSERGEFKPYGFEVGSAEVEELRHVVSVLTEAMEHAQYPANPGGPHGPRSGQCQYCPYDGVCPTDRQRSWDRVRTDPALSQLVELVEPS